MAKYIDLVMIFLLARWRCPQFVYDCPFFLLFSLAVQ